MANAAEVIQVTEIVDVLLPVILKYGILAVNQVITAIHNDPKLPVDQIADTIRQRLTDTASKDQQVLGEKD
jgi:hypothetical protein